MAGVFVGVLAVEIMKRTEPEVTGEIEEKAKNAVGAVVAAFKEGYGGEDIEAVPMEPEQSAIWGLSEDPSPPAPLPASGARGGGFWKGS